MHIYTDYDGSSINLIDNDKVNNRIIVSPKTENGSLSSYYNFKVKNDSEKKGYICITDFDKTAYYNDNLEYLPYIKKENGNYEHINKDKVFKKDADYIIQIAPKEALEISLYPRYVEKDLNMYVDKLLKVENVVIKKDVLTEIIIGDTNNKVIAITARQHPGETLSSYFVEGIIDHIIKYKDDYSNYCFIIFPMVNVLGVKNGCHRYLDNTDYNRSWGRNNIKEIEFIKQELKKYDILTFIDVHGDEISKFDYIRTNMDSLKNIINSIRVLDDQTKMHRFLRALVVQKKFINVFSLTAREYMSKNYNCDNILVELSLMNNDQNSSKEKGCNFISEFVKGIEYESTNSRKK